MMQQPGFGWGCFLIEVVKIDAIMGMVQHHQQAKNMKLSAATQALWKKVDETLGKNTKLKFFISAYEASLNEVFPNWRKEFPETEPLFELRLECEQLTNLDHITFLKFFKIANMHFFAGVELEIASHYRMRSSLIPEARKQIDGSLPPEECTKQLNEILKRRLKS